MYNHTANNQFYPVNETVFNDTNLIQTHSTSSNGNHANGNCRHNLLQLIRQHQNQTGWILLVAPAHLPDKEWAEHYQLSLHNVLVIHQKQISDLYATIQQALGSNSCKVVINFGTQLEQEQIDRCRRLALQNHTWFYQYDHLVSQQSQH